MGDEAPMKLRRVQRSGRPGLVKPKRPRARRPEQKKAAPPSDAFLPPQAPALPAPGAIATVSIRHAWSQQLRDTAHQTSGQLKSAARSLHDGADGLGIAEPMGLEAHGLADQANALGSNVESSATLAHVPAGELRGQAAELQQRADGFYARVVHAAQAGRDFAAGVVDKIADGASAIGRAVKLYTQGVASAVDYEENIDQLGDTDTYTLGIDALIVLGGPAVRGAGAIEVSRNSDLYTVAVDGALGAGVFAEAGIQLFGLGVDTHGSVTAGRGVRYELTFASAGEAKKAVRLVLSRLGKSATLRPLTQDERELFSRNLTAVELHRDVAAEGLAILGLKGFAAAMAEAGTTTDHVVRVELGDEPALVLTHELSAEVYGALGLATETDGGWAGHSGVGTMAGDASVLLQRRIQLGAGFDPRELAANPARQLAALGTRAVGSTATESVQLMLEGKGGVLGGGGGFEVGLTVGAGIDEVKKSGAIGRVLRGDLSGALKNLPPSTEVTGRFNRFADYGVDIGPAVFFMGFGADVDLEALRRDIDAPNTKTTDTTAGKGALEVDEWLKTLGRHRTEA